MFTASYARLTISVPKGAPLKPCAAGAGILPSYLLVLPTETFPRMPSKPKDVDKLTRPVSFRLTAADHAAYLAKVEASGLKPSAFFRDAVLKNRTQIVARAKSSPERGRLVYLMNKASNNINQLAHRANADNLTGVISEETYARVLHELEVVSRAMKRAAFDAD